MSKPYQAGGTSGFEHGSDCPPSALWAEIAMGLTPTSQAMECLKHAAGCESCAGELRDALQVLRSDDGPPSDIAEQLMTGTQKWQQEFAVEMAARIHPSTATVISSAKKVRLIRLRPWIYTGIAAVLALAIGTGLFLHFRQRSVQELIALAYTEQRPIDLRISGATYAPIRVQRASGISQLNKPQSLLEAELLIKKGLDSRPEDGSLLREKAEADLLNGNYQPALETLNHAARVNGDSFNLLLDLATAYFERAEATDNPADYETGLQTLGDAIRLRPADPTALFNRAIIYERLYFYGRATADWEELLKIEKDPGWRHEAEQRLKEIRERQQHRSAWQDPDQLSIEQFTANLSDRRQSGIEEYVAAAERRILPQLSSTDGHGANYRAATLLAEVLESQHSDRLVKDLLAASNLPQFPKAARLLGQSSAANHTGHYEEAYALATQSAKLFAQMGNTAGTLSSEFEEAYALQLEARAGSCASLAGKTATLAHESRYPLLEVQLLLEQTICSDMGEDLGQAKTLMLKALQLAQSHDYQSFYVRGLTALAHLDNQAGDESGTWSAIQEGLALCWNRALPAVRAYSLYAILDLDAERLGHVNVQFAASFESVHFGFQNPDPGIEAAERMRLANAAIGSREMHTAQSEFEQAAHIFSAAPATDSIHWRELEARLGLARVKALQGSNVATTAAILLESLPELQHLSNRYLEFEYYQTLADLQWRLGNAQETKHFLNEAIRLTETGLRSLPTWTARSAWMEQHRQSYLLTTQLLLREGKEQAALELWEHFRSADISSQTDREAKPVPREKTDHKVPPDSRDPSPEKAILTYALGGQDLLIWVRQSQITHAVAMAAPHDLRRTVENFVSECSRPDSDIGNVRADAETLYSWLVGPVRQWLPTQGRLIVEPDGILANVPFEALIDPSSAHYLETSYSVTVAPTVQATLASPNNKGISANAQALIIAAPAGTNSLGAPPPGAFIEARHVAQRFHHPVLLAGKDAAVLPVQRELIRAAVLHFAGHATLTRNGVAIILADGTLSTAQTQGLASHQLSRMQLAVFSACNTARATELQESQGLVSGFLHAGTQNVLASRWNVDSVATTDFVDLFYDSLLSGHDVAESVQAAAGTFLKTPGRDHPYYWAAFSAFGRA